MRGYFPNISNSFLLVFNFLHVIFIRLNYYLLILTNFKFLFQVHQDTMKQHYDKRNARTCNCVALSRRWEIRQCFEWKRSVKIARRSGVRSNQSSADRRLVTKTVVASCNKFRAMRTAWILSLVMSPLLVLGSPPGSTFREGGIKIGTGRGTIPKGINQGRGNSAVRIGEGGRLSNATRQRSFPTTTTTTATPTRFTPQSSVGNNYNITDLKVRMRPFQNEKMLLGKEHLRICQRFDSLNLN